MTDATRPDDHDPDAVTDDELGLLTELGAVIGTDPLPAGIVTRAAALSTWFRVDDELVALLSEHAEEAAGARGGAAVADVYATADGELEVEVELGDGRVIGTLTIGDHEVVSLVDAAGAAGPEVEIDELGRFEITTDAHGPHRLRFEGPNNSRTVTEWILL